MKEFENQLVLARHGDVNAMVYVADNYFYGVDIVGDDLYQNMVKAEFWYSKACDLGSEYAKDMVMETRMLILDLKEAA